MAREEKMRGLEWLRKVRGKGSEEDKRMFLLEMGYLEGEVEELLREEKGPEAPLFG